MNINMDAKNKMTTNSNIKAKKKFKFSKLILPIVLVALCVGGYFGYRALEFSNSIGIKVKAGDLLNNITQKPELDKDSTKKYTTALIVGLDTRASGGTLNTDSMILATYNYDTKNITMISIPRDVWVTIPGYQGKVNGVYATGERNKKGGGMKFLGNALTTITGIEVQYYAMVDLEGFTKMIDAVGGVTVNVDNTFTDYCYPAGRSAIEEHRSHFCSSLGGQGETITFKKGIQTMSAKDALQYARSRHAAGVEGLDWARARRQQKVIEALKEKMLTSETLFNPQKVMEILGAIQNNVKLYGLDLTDIQAAINLATEYKKDPGGTYHFVLEPSFGGGKIITSCPKTVTTLSAQCPTAGNGDFTGIRSLVRLCLKEPEIYDENPVVRVYDVGMGSAAAKAKAQEIIAKYPYLNIVYFGKLKSGKEGIIVYRHESKYKGTVAELSKFLDATSVAQPEYITNNLNGENVTILLGKPVTATSTN
ncbi:LCP family protein [Candidatus Dojkabacteria bacterium]|jgi:LCP family protein required for cell wall assembly|nr:LCP family protein [Candidatus Dojkabacteria bacterium]